MKSLIPMNGIAVQKYLLCLCSACGFFVCAYHRQMLENVDWWGDNLELQVHISSYKSLPVRFLGFLICYWAFEEPTISYWISSLLLQFFSSCSCTQKQQQEKSLSQIRPCISIQLIKLRQQQLVTGKYWPIRLWALMKSVKCMRPVVTKALAFRFLWPFIVLHWESWKQQMVLLKIQCGMNFLQIRWAQGLGGRIWGGKGGHSSGVRVFLKQINKSPKDVMGLNLKLHIVLYLVKQPG